MQLTVNGTEQRVTEAWRDETLLSTLREYFGLVGARHSCGMGLCGACKVLVDGVPVSSCSVRTADMEGRTILERVPQCGYCQSGQIIQALALLSGNPRPSEEEIVTAMAGNLCRCGSYDRIKKAIRRAADQLAEAGERPDG